MGQDAKKQNALEKCKSYAEIYRNVTNPVVESIIEKYLEGEPIDGDKIENLNGYLKDIMAWKGTNKIDQFRTIRKDGIVHKDMSNISFIELEQIVREYKANFTEDDYKKLFIRLVEVSGIGNVYAITIIYFLSHGEYPIYDRFADVGLYSVITRQKEKIPLRMMSDMKIDDAWNYYLEYIDALTSLFGDGWKGKEGRNIDKGLWAYGHTVESVACKQTDGDRFYHFYKKGDAHEK